MEDFIHSPVSNFHNYKILLTLGDMLDTNYAYIPTPMTMFEIGLKENIKNSKNCLKFRNEKVLSTKSIFHALFKNKYKFKFKTNIYLFDILSIIIIILVMFDREWHSPLWLAT